MSPAKTRGQIRVLVVDDSAFMRVALRKMMESDPGIEVVGIARNGEEALDKIRQYRPDLVTLDIEMPVLDGLTTLQHIMDEMPLPVIMISALTEEGADATFRALEMGAVDFIPKGGKSYVNLDIIKVGEQLRQKIRAIVKRNRSGRLFRDGQGIDPEEMVIRERQANVSDAVAQCDRKVGIVAIGVSTGGPMALNRIVPRFPATFQGKVLVVQHMPPVFTGPFAERLNAISQVPVIEAKDGDTPESGCVYIAPGGVHMKIGSRSHTMRICLDHQPEETLFIPSVDVMMLSLAERFGGDVLGVIMTGMGSDGFQGMSRIKNKGGMTLAQDRASCVVYGMPRVCVENGLIDHVVTLDQMADTITHLAG